MERQPLDRSPEDIDLVGFFYSIFKGISRITFLVLNNLLVFFSFFLVISLIGYSLRYVVPKYYITKGVFVTRLLPASYCNFLVNGLNDQTKSYDVTAVAQELHVSYTVAESIRRISSESISQDTTLLDRDDPDAAGFAIQLKLERIEDLDSIQAGLIYYLENSNYALARKAARKKNLVALQSTLSERLQSLDSLKRALSSSYASHSKEQGIVFGETANPVSVYKEEMNYYKEQLLVNEKLSNPDNIEVLQPFVRLGRPNYPDFSLFFKLSLVAGLVLALIFTPLIGLQKERKRHGVRG